MLSPQNPIAELNAFLPAEKTISAKCELRQEEKYLDVSFFLALYICQQTIYILWFVIVIEFC